MAIEDGFPVAEGHLLVVPLRHVESFFELSEFEARDVWRALGALQEELASADRRIEGFNVGVNIGAVAGQTVPHAHIHLIPRRRGDTSTPRGGVRGVIPERMSY